jgi:asparagine synthase (glutamine-hydrolysing)
MCGIAGIIGAPNKITIESLQSMTGILAHRGPDGDGHWINGEKQVGLGHRRLAIIDLSDAGSQPMHFQNSRYTIVYNGEIYNYIEIKENLIRQGYQFQTTCDTEVLLALFDAKKENCLSDLDGMFSFAIWDERERRLFCARDRFGEKPFYFALHQGALYFASEMKALWAAGVPKEINNRMLFNYMAYGYVYNPENLAETFHRNVFKLKAAN